MTNLVGQTLNNYQIIELLGGGGMAQVYKAYHPGLDVYRAIKVIRPEFVNQPGFKERFQREAQAVAKLRHPNIVQVHDYGVQDNLYFMVMEFIEGQDLKNYLKQHSAIRPFNEIVSIIEQVASALHYAHQASVLHRDIKPANIMLTAQKQAILTDFGIAKILQREQEGEQTEAGVSIGTPAYMSPEQAKGLPDINPTADLYSLGIVLYEMLTGRVPYLADTPLAVILKVVNEPLPPPRTFSPDIPDVLQGVVLKATAKNPAQRYQTGEAFVDGLKHSLNITTGDVSVVTVPTLETPASQTRVTPAPLFINKKITWLVGSIFAVLIILCVLLAVIDVALYLRPTPALSLATWQFVVDASAGMNDPLDGRAKIDIARAALGKELRILPDNVNAGLRIFGGETSGLTACEDTKLLVKPTTRHSQNITSALANVTPKGQAPLTEAIVQTIGDFDLTSDTKNTLIVITAGLDTCEADAITQLQTLTRRLGIEFDLHLIGLGVKDPTQSQELENIAQAAGGDYYAAENEEDVGRVLHDQISILQGTPVAVQPSSTPTETPSPTATIPAPPTATPPPPTSTPKPLPTSNPQLIAFVSKRDGNDEIYVVNADGSGLTNLTNHPADDVSPVWSPDGRRIAFVSERDSGGIYIMDAEGGGLTFLTGGRNPTWSPDGNRIAFVSNQDYNAEIFVINVDGSAETRLTNRPTDDTHPVWSPDGKYIAFESEESNKNDEIYVMNADGKEIINLTNNPSHDTRPSWSPDGKQIAFSSDRDNRAQVFVTNVDGSGLTLFGEWGSYEPHWSPDGQRIAFGYTQDVYVKNADGSGQIQVTNNPGYDAPCSWSPDNQRIAFVSDISRDGDYTFFVINIDGSGQTKLADSPGSNCAIVWSPQ